MENFDFLTKLCKQKFIQKREKWKGKIVKKYVKNKENIYESHEPLKLIIVPFNGIPVHGGFVLAFKMFAHG